MKRVLLFFLLLPCAHIAMAQGYLGLVKDSLLKLNTTCSPEANYKNELAYKCDGIRSIFYFDLTGKCDLWAQDLSPQAAHDTLTAILKSGFTKMGTKYVEAFLMSKRNPNHQKFPSTVYAKGKILYSIMPVSLDGKTGTLNSMIVMYVKNKAVTASPAAPPAYSK